MTPEDIVAKLASNNKQEREAAAAEAMLLGEGAAGLAVELVTHAGDSDIGEPCVAALEELGTPPVEAINGLTRLLEADEMPAYWAATLLGRLGQDATPASAALAQIASSDGPLAVRERAVWAIGKIGPGAAVALPVLESLTNAAQPRLARLAKQAAEAVQG